MSQIRSSTRLKASRAPRWRIRVLDLKDICPYLKTGIEISMLEKIDRVKFLDFKGTVPRNIFSLKSGYIGGIDL